MRHMIMVNWSGWRSRERHISGRALTELLGIIDISSLYAWSRAISCRRKASKWRLTSSGNRSAYKVEWFLNELGEPFVRVNIPENMSLTLDEAHDFGNGLIEAWQSATQATKGRGTD